MEHGKFGIVNMKKKNLEYNPQYKTIGGKPYYCYGVTFTAGSAHRMADILRKEGYYVRTKLTEEGYETWCCLKEYN